MHGAQLPSGIQIRFSFSGHMPSNNPWTSLCPLGEAMEGQNSENQLQQQGSSDRHKLKVHLGPLFNARTEMHILLFSNI